MAKGWLIALIVLAVVGVILVAVGGGLIPFLNSKIKSTIDENVELVNQTDSYNAWLSPPADIFIDFYFFDVLNPDNVVHNRSKPILRERGPYVYREVRDKWDVEFLNESTLLRYKEAKYYVFDRTRSVGGEDDSITNVNLAMLTIATKLQDYRSFIRRIVRVFVDDFKETLFQRHTVREMLWGYRPSIVDEINNVLAKIPFVYYRFNISAGLYIGSEGNGTSNGELEISTGKKDVDKLGVVNTWNGLKKLSYWTTPECNMINGTDGTLWHPFVQRSDTLYLFNTDLCRSVYIQYLADSTVSSSNIPVYTFAAPVSVMANETVNPDNIGFCYPNASYCLGTGVLDVSTCRDGAPIVMSQPHFFEADPKYQTAVDGLDPTNAKYRTLVDVEPNTGVVLNAAKKVQVNVYIRQLDTFTPTMNLAHDHYIFPMVWGNEHATIPDNEAAKFRTKVLDPILVTKFIKFGLMGLGLALIVIVVVIAIVLGVQHRNQVSHHLEDDDDPLLEVDADG